MSAITPSSDLYLLKCPLEMDNQHQLNFASKTAQYNYFSSLPKKLNIDEDDYSYIRQNSVLRIGAHIDSLLEYNYVMYRNDNYSNKWFYAFIVNMEYLNDNCTAVTIKTDVWQTWGLDVTFRKCYVEREHVNSDTIGENTIPENFELGEFICNSRLHKMYANTDANGFSKNTVLCFQVTKLTVGNNTFPQNDYNIVTGLPQGCFIFGKELDNMASGTISFVTGLYDSNGLGDAIVSIFLVPKACCTWETKTDTLGNSWLVPQASYGAVTMDSVDLSINTTLDGYTPKNKKLYTYPYNYLYVTNNAGADVTYKWEQFLQNAPYFTVTGAFEQGGSLMLEPVNSKSSDNNAVWGAWNEGIPSGKLPTLSWTSDYYLNWQAVNSKNVEIQTGLMAFDFAAGNITGIIAGAMGDDKASGGGMGVGTFASNVANTMQQVRQARMTPPQAKGNTNSGSLQFCADRCGWTFRKMSVRAEYARKIDDYWTAYGYQVNSYKVPNITGRQNWNYVKCIDVNILGNIPQQDMDEIKGLFNRGITIWHNPATFLDYNQTNNIV